MHFLALGVLGSSYFCMPYQFSVRPGLASTAGLVVLAVAVPTAPSAWGWDVLAVVLLCGCHAVPPIVMLAWAIRYVDRRWMGMAARLDWVLGLAVAGGGLGVCLGGVGKVLAM